MRWTSRNQCKIFVNYLTLGEIRLPKDTDGPEYFCRRLPMGTQPTLPRNVVCTRLHWRRPTPAYPSFAKNSRQRVRRPARWNSPTLSKMASFRYETIRSSNLGSCFRSTYADNGRLYMSSKKRKKESRNKQKQYRYGAWRRLTRVRVGKRSLQ